MSIEELIKAEVNNANPTNQTHHDICVALAKFADDNQLPYWLVGLVSISSSAHKKSAFDNGYKSINLERASQVFNLSTAVAEKFGKKSLRTNVRVVLGCARFIKAKGTMGEFMDAINAIEELPTTILTAKDFNKLLFGKTRKFDKVGRLAIISDAETPKKKAKKTTAKKAKVKELDITNEVVEVGEPTPATTTAE